MAGWREEDFYLTQNTQTLNKYGSESLRCKDIHLFRPSRLGIVDASITLRSLLRPFRAGLRAENI